ncbi:MAG: hypothetical protein IPO49_11265 [Bacteroidetes bacterium]|nr:hypothetical protein [Bacteroidota bacterium]
MKLHRFFFAILLLSCFSNLSAQDVQERISKLFTEDSTDIQTLAMYPAETRTKLLTASTHPDALARINDANKKSNEQFRKLIESYSKEDQEKIWNLTRFDGLIQKLALLNPPEGEPLEEILKSYPPEAQANARVVSSKFPSIAIDLDKQQKSFASEFDNVLREYTGNDQEAFRTLLQQPEALSLLNDNMNMTVRLGDLYKADPASVSKKMDDLALELAAQKARDTEEWKQTVKNDPEAKKELEESTKEYAKENGYKDDELTNVDVRIVERPVFYSYPYWCGYPYWYTTPMWTPYPYWYHSGFYFWQGDIVIIGQPSWYFMHWHFYNHPHFYHYPHLSAVYVNYYHGPRRAAARNSREVNGWVQENRSNLPRDFFVKDKAQPERIREYGKQVPRTPEQRDVKPVNSQPRDKQNDLSKPKELTPPREMAPSKPREPKNVQPARDVTPSAPKQGKEKVSPPVIRLQKTPKEVKPSPVPSTPKQAPAKKTGGKRK